MNGKVGNHLYLVLNLAARKAYVGRTKDLRTRFIAHRSALRDGKHPNTQLQNDWNQYGEANFIWLDVAVRAGTISGRELEDLLIELLESMKTSSGYNQMTSAGWSRQARLRSVEQKLIRSRKFQMLEGIRSTDPMKDWYVDACSKGHGIEEMSAGE